MRSGCRNGQNLILPSETQRQALGGDFKLGQLPKWA